MFLHIFSWLSSAEVVACSEVSRLWHDLAHDFQLWGAVTVTPAQVWRVIWGWMDVGVWIGEWMSVCADWWMDVGVWIGVVRWKTHTALACKT